MFNADKFSDGCRFELCSAVNLRGFRKLKALGSWDGGGVLVNHSRHH